MFSVDIENLLRSRPFGPFRIVTSDGTTYEVRHPELVLVSLSSAVIGYPAPGRPRTAERYDIVNMQHIVRLEPLEAAAAAPAGQN